MSAPSKIPYWISIGGVAPFAALAFALWIVPTGQSAQVVTWLVSYGAVILTFVGALHCGVALVHPEVPERDRELLMGWSVVPALMAWAALALPSIVGLSLLVVMFIVQWEADRRLDRRFPVTPGFLRLRGQLTAAVVVCIILGALSLLRSGMYS